MPEEFIAQADTRGPGTPCEMRVKATGQAARSAWAYVWKIDQGMMSDYREYVDTVAVSRAHSTSAVG